VFGAYGKRLMLLGAPGVGKGTYASRAAEILKIPTISTGDLVRAAIKNGTAIGAELKRYTDKGELVPDDVIIQMVDQTLKNVKSGYILDGFPRTLYQAEAFDKVVKLDFVVNLEQEESVIITKIASRRCCVKCGKVYNLADIKFEGGIHMPPLLPKVDGICDLDGGKLIQRDDDKEEVVVHRLKIYEQQSLPLVKYYEKKGMLRHFKVLGGVKELLPSFIELLNK
jgi:adenylate kinase